MSQYQFTPQATGDLFEIWNFIAHDNPEAADRVEEANPCIKNRGLVGRWRTADPSLRSG
jgi:hypothetical protein